MSLTELLSTSAKFTNVRLIRRNFSGKMLGEFDSQPSFGIDLSKHEAALLELGGVVVWSKADPLDEYLTVNVDENATNIVSVKLDIDGEPLNIDMFPQNYPQLDSVDAYYDVEVDFRPVMMCGKTVYVSQLKKLVMKHKHRESGTPHLSWGEDKTYGTSWGEPKVKRNENAS